MLSRTQKWLTILIACVLAIGLAVLVNEFLFEFPKDDWRRFVTCLAAGILAGYFGGRRERAWQRRINRKEKEEFVRNMEAQYGPRGVNFPFPEMRDGPKEEWVDWPFMKDAPPGAWLKGAEIMFNGRKGRIVDYGDNSVKVEWLNRSH